MSILNFVQMPFSKENKVINNSKLDKVFCQKIHSLKRSTEMILPYGKQASKVNLNGIQLGEQDVQVGI